MLLRKLHRYQVKYYTLSSLQTDDSWQSLRIILYLDYYGGDSYRFSVVERVETMVSVIEDAYYMSCEWTFVSVFTCGSL